MANLFCSKEHGTWHRFRHWNNGFWITIDTHTKMLHKFLKMLRRTFNITPAPLWLVFRSQFNRNIQVKNTKRILLCVSIGFRIFGKLGYIFIQTSQSFEFRLHCLLCIFQNFYCVGHWTQPPNLTFLLQTFSIKEREFFLFIFKPKYATLNIYSLYKGE